MVTQGLQPHKHTCTLAYGLLHAMLVSESQDWDTIFVSWEQSYAYKHPHWYRSVTHLQWHVLWIRSLRIADQ